MYRAIALLPMIALLLAPVYAEKISLDDGGVTFEAPEEFTPLSKEEIGLKYPAARAPKYVIANKTGGTSIAYDIKPNDIGESGLEELRELFTQIFPRMIPGLEWIENKTIEMDGREWVYLEMTSSAIDTDIHNIMLFTGYKGQMLAFNFNSTKEEFKKYEKVLRDAIKTIKIKGDTPREKTEEDAKAEPV